MVLSLGPGPAHHLPEPEPGEEGGAGGDVQGGDPLQHAGQVQPGPPLPLQRPPHPRLQERVSRHQHYHQTMGYV